MNRIEIKHWSGRVLYTHKPDESSELTTMRHALEAATKSCADLRGANLCCADLRGANLRGADLRGANLRGADLRGADLRGANLSGAKLRGADLRGANLSDADLSDANLSDADLRDATIYGIKITRQPLMLSGLEWDVLVFDGHIKIGCQLHAISAWEAFDDYAIVAMDGRGALRFWREHKVAIMALAAPFAGISKAADEVAA